MPDKETIIITITIEKFSDGTQRVAATEGANIREMENMLMAAYSAVQKKVILEDLRAELMKHMPKPTGLINQDGRPIIKN